MERARLRTRTAAVVTASLVALASVTAAIMVLRDAGKALVVFVPVDRPDAIVALASHEWERLPAVAELAQRNPASVVVLTEPATITELNCHDCGNRPNRLEAAGVRRDRIRILRLTGHGTYGEAVAVRAYARARGLRRLAVVTSPYHTRRAFAVFRKVFESDSVAIGVTPALEQSASVPDRWWTSASDRWYVRYEWLAIGYYTIKYGVSPVRRQPGGWPTRRAELIAMRFDVIRLFSIHAGVGNRHIFRVLHSHVAKPIRPWLLRQLFGLHPVIVARKRG